MRLSFAAVRRDPRYSPGHEETDRLMLSRTAAELERRGHRVDFYEELAPSSEIAAPVIFHMCQSPSGIAWLQDLESEGRVLVNSARSVLSCYRIHQLGILERAGLCMPESVIVSLDGRQRTRAWKGRPVWLKRGDAHATQAGDVQRVESEMELAHVLDAFRRRGLTHAVVQEHVEGAQVKFYAVRGTEFFYWYLQGPGAGVPVDAEALRAIASGAADALGLDVYGGDVLVDKSGAMVLIDVNDWPSFAPCRDAAAPYVAELIEQRALARRDGRDARGSAAELTASSETR